MVGVSQIPMVKVEARNHSLHAGFEAQNAAGRQRVGLFSKL